MHGNTEPCGAVLTWINKFWVGKHGNTEPWGAHRVGQAGKPAPGGMRGTGCDVAPCLRSLPAASGSLGLVGKGEGTTGSPLPVLDMGQGGGQAQSSLLRTLGGKFRAVV